MSHGCQFAIQRNTNNQFLYVRYRENNAWGTWNSIRVDVAQVATGLTAGNQTINGNLTATGTIDCNGTITPTMLSVLIQELIM